MVQGINHDSAACSSNGSGKSAISDILRWVLDGTTSRGVKGSDIVRRGSTGGAEGRFAYFDDGHIYDIVRYQDHATHKNGLEFCCDGKSLTLADKAQTQVLIQEKLGFNTKNLWSVLFIGQSGLPFTRRDSSDRKELVNQILGVNQIREAYNRALARAKALDVEILALTSKKTLLESQIANAIAESHRWAEKDREWEEDRASRLRSLRESLEDSENVETPITLAATKDCGPEIEILESEIRRLSSECSKANSQVAVYDSKVSDLRRTLLPEGGAICPKCKQLVPESHVQEVQTEIENEIREFVDSKKCWSETAAQLESGLLDSRSILRDVRKRDTEAKAERAKRETEDRLRAARVSQILAELEQLEQATSPFAEGESRAKDQARQAQSELFDVSASLDSFQKDNKYVYFWEQAFSRTSPNNLEGRIISIALPYLTERTNSYLDKLFDGQVKIEFEIDATGKREKLDHRVVNSQGAEGYSGQSAGEAERVDIAVGLALADLLFARLGKVFGFVSIDEPVAYADEAGGARILELVKSLDDTDRTILFTTHRRELLELWDGARLLVTKENGISRCAVEGIGSPS